jgi:hypothetical protein
MAIIWVGTGRFSAYIGPVQDYIDRVVAADVAAGNTLGLEVGVRDAYDVFIRDSINVGDLGTSGGVLSQANSIIKAAPIMAGARTLAGALVPVVGTAPTRFGTEGGWNYNRKTGTAGNGTDNYLNSNRANNADPQDNNHNAVHVQSAGLAGRSIMAAGGAAAGSNALGTGGGVRSRNSDVDTSISSPTGFFGASRAASSSFTIRAGGSNFAKTRASQTPVSDNLFVFADSSSGTPSGFSTGRYSFYSIGESLNLALLDTRLTTLINAIAAAIP